MHILHRLHTRWEEALLPLIKRLRLLLQLLCLLRCAFTERLRHRFRLAAHEGQQWLSLAQIEQI